MHNLIDNAGHALEEKHGACIRLSATEAAEHILETGTQSVAITVSDNGVGIDSDRLTQVFTPFYSTRSQGTGLGLAMVQRLVRALGGVVQLDSERGVGTTITLLLPANE